MKNNNFIGKNYGQLTVLSYSHNKNTRRYWNCQCTCGNITQVSTSHLSNTKSCGCLRDALSKERLTTHGDNRCKEHNSWRAMLDRCYNIKHKYYHNYGNRGIIVCERWKNSYSNFLEDMGRAPDKFYSLDRINNEGNYTKENCKWSTGIEQGINKRNNVNNVINNETLTISEIRRKFNISKGCMDRYLYVLKLSMADIIKNYIKEVKTENHAV